MGVTKREGVEEVGLRCFMNDATEGISYLEGETLPKNCIIVTKRIRKVFDKFRNSMVKSGGMTELKFRCVSPCISGRDVGVN